MHLVGDTHGLVLLTDEEYARLNALRRKQRRWDRVLRVCLITLAVACLACAVWRIVGAI